MASAGEDVTHTNHDGTRDADAARYESTITILERARRGDANATLVLLERTVAPLRRWARGRLPPFARAGADTGDVVQDVVVRALAGIKRFEYRTVDALQLFLRESVRNRIRDEIRRVMRRGVTEELAPDLAADTQSPLEQLILQEGSERYLEALRKLRPGDRIAIIYRLEHRYPYEEIARRMDKVSTDAARVAVSRALKRLAAELRLVPTDARRSTASGAADRGAVDPAKRDS
jgi:RNA polymerase sigma-70 factor (ECF subfamily)